MLIYTIISNLGVIAAYIVTHSHVLRDAYYTCILILNSMLVCQMVNCLTLTAISIERFLAIRYPLWYKVNYTKRVVWNSIVTIWSYACIYLILAMFVFNLKSDWMRTPVSDRRCRYVDALEYTFYTYACAIPTNIVPMIIMVSVYLYIWKIVKGRGKAAHKLGLKYSVDQERAKAKEMKEVSVDTCCTFKIYYWLFICAYYILYRTP